MSDLTATGAIATPDPTFKRSTSHPRWRLAVGLLVLSIALLMIGSGIGSTGWESVWTMWQQEVARQIVWEIRLPRTLGAWSAGALLGLSGAVAQGLFRNPLADPYLLGSASGAHLGVAAALAVFSVSPFASDWLVRLGLTGAAFLGSVLAVMLTLVLARGVAQTLRLLLSGVIVGVVLGALSSLLSMTRPEIVQTMQAFMLGSTGFVGWTSCGLMLAVLLLCGVVAMGLSKGLDALSLGETSARSLGLPLPQIRFSLVLVIALSAATAVAQTGLIVFVGLAAPHLVRAVVTNTHASLIALSALMGGVLLMFADVLSRSLIAPQELPVGVLTALLGGAYLLRLMYQQRGANQVGGEL